MENKDLIKKWLEGELDSREMLMFRTSKEYQQYGHIVEKAAKFQRPQFETNKGLEDLKRRLSETQASPKKNLITSDFFKLAAVLIVILASGLFFWMNRGEVIATGNGEMLTLVLPDASTVKLNAGSEIKFSPSDWKDERKLKLDGEAFFSVEKGQKFTVHTEQGTVSVLGTRFNVKERENFFEVSCFEGAVKVTAGKKEIILSKGHSVQILAGKLQEISSFDRSLPGWTLQESEFDAVPFRHVIEEMERQFDLQIETKNVDLDQVFTGSFGHSDKEVALKAISIPLGLEYEIKSGNRVILYGE